MKKMDFLEDKNYQSWKIEIITKLGLKKNLPWKKKTLISRFE